MYVMHFKRLLFFINNYFPAFIISYRMFKEHKMLTIPIITHSLLNEDKYVLHNY